MDRRSESGARILLQSFLFLNSQMGIRGSKCKAKKYRWGKRIDFDSVLSISFLFCIWNFHRFSIKWVMKFFIVGILRLLLWIIFILNKFNWFFNFLVNFYLMKSSFVLTYCFQSSSSCSFKENEYSFPSHINFLNFRYINFYRSVMFLPLIIKLKHFFLFFSFYISSAMKKATDDEKGMKCWLMECFVMNKFSSKRGISFFDNKIKQFIRVLF